MDQVFMSYALDEAREAMAAGEDGPFGAVIVRNGSVIARSRNLVRERADPTAHAELNVIRGAAAALGTTDLSTCEIYTSCEPCPMCLTAAMWAGIRTIYYACSKEEAASLGYHEDLDAYRRIQQGRDLPVVALGGDARSSALSLFRSRTARSEGQSTV